MGGHRVSIQVISRTYLAATIAVALPIVAKAQIFKGETADTGDPVHTMFVAFSNRAGKAGVELQVNAGQTPTRSMLKGTEGDIDFFSTVLSLVNLMAGQSRMYENIENAPELAKKLRTVPGFKAGAYRPVTLAGSGIETWEDIEGDAAEFRRGIRGPGRWQDRHDGALRRNRVGQYRTLWSLWRVSGSIVP